MNSLRLKYENDEADGENQKQKISLSRTHTVHTELLTFAHKNSFA